VTAARVAVALLALLGLLFAGPIVYWYGTYVGLYLACRHADDAERCAEAVATRLLTVPEK